MDGAGAPNRPSSPQQTEPSAPPSEEDNGNLGVRPASPTTPPQGSFTPSLFLQQFEDVPRNPLGERSVSPSAPPLSLGGAMGGRSQSQWELSQMPPLGGCGGFPFKFIADMIISGVLAKVFRVLTALVAEGGPLGKMAEALLKLHCIANLTLEQVLAIDSEQLFDILVQSPTPFSTWIQWISVFNNLIRAAKGEATIE